MFNFTLSFLHLTNIYRVLKEQETGLNAVEGAEMIQNLIMYGLSYRTHYTLDQREDRQINNYNVTGAEIDRCTAQCVEERKRALIIRLHC